MISLLPGAKIVVEYGKFLSTAIVLLLFWPLPFTPELTIIFCKQLSDAAAFGDVEVKLMYDTPSFHSLNFV